MVMDMGFPNWSSYLRVPLWSRKYRSGGIQELSLSKPWPQIFISHDWKHFHVAVQCQKLQHLIFSLQNFQLVLLDLGSLWCPRQIFCYCSSPDTEKGEFVISDMTCVWWQCIVPHFFITPIFFKKCFVKSCNKEPNIHETKIILAYHRY